jgi:hypothetical protein
MPLSPARSPVARLPRACSWTSRSCSTGRFVRRGWGLASLDAAPLFGFHPPPGTCSRAVPGHPGSAPDLTAGISSTPSRRVGPASRPSACCQRVHWHEPSPVAPTCSRFSAFHLAGEPTIRRGIVRSGLHLGGRGTQHAAFLGSMESVSLLRLMRILIPSRS